jgi:beta-phosphoglucomutase-like phosphatase (HAD superfamily)
MGLPAGECLALEDSANGVRAARGAGIDVVVSESIYTSGDDFSGALAVFPDFAKVDLARLRQLHP